MISPGSDDQLEQQRLLRLAKEYRSKGYTVVINPSSTDLPSALASCSLGLIAKNEAKTIAVEVRTRDSLTLNGSRDLRQIADKVHEIPNWEFELVVTNPRKKSA
jgi:REase_AHJR-like